MADNVQDATFEILTGIQSSIAMMRATAGYFEERIRRLEDRVDELQRQHG